MVDALYVDYLELYPLWTADLRDHMLYSMDQVLDDFNMIGIDLTGRLENINALINAHGTNARMYEGAMKYANEMFEYEDIRGDQVIE